MSVWCLVWIIFGVIQFSCWRNAACRLLSLLHEWWVTKWYYNISNTEPKPNVSLWLKLCALIDSDLDIKYLKISNICSSQLHKCVIVYFISKNYEKTLSEQKQVTHKSHLWKGNSWRTIFLKTKWQDISTIFTNGGTFFNFQPNQKVSLHFCAEIISQSMNQSSEY